MSPELRPVMQVTLSSLAKPKQTAEPAAVLWAPCQSIICTPGTRNYAAVSVDRIPLRNWYSPRQGIQDGANDGCVPRRGNKTDRQGVDIVWAEARQVAPPTAERQAGYPLLGA
jgi:hypothetical protein